VTANPGSAPAPIVNVVGACNIGDRLTITSSSGSGPNASPPVTCGTLTGSHSKLLSFLHQDQSISHSLTLSSLI